MAYDALAPGIVQAQTTATGSITGTALDFKTLADNAGERLSVRFRDLSRTVATAGLSYYYKVQQSDDTTTWIDDGATDTITPTTATVTNKPPYMVYFVRTKRYVRGMLVMSATTGTPSVVYAAELGAGTTGPG